MERRSAADAAVIEYRAVNGAALEALGRRNAEPVRAIPTPFEAWNAMCHGRGGFVGLAHGWHVLAAGRSGQGKTYLALNIAAAAIAAGESVAFHSLEMDWDELATRILSIVSGEPAWRLSPGKYYSPRAYEAACEAMDETRGELLINHEPIYQLGHIVSGMQRMYAHHGARLHIIDYLQLAWIKHAETMAERITEVSHAVRQVARDHSLVSLGLSQLNRESSKDAGKPRKEGMIGSSALENDANQVVLLDHSRWTALTNGEGRRSGWQGWLSLDKNRHGPVTEVPIEFSAATGRIRQRDPDEIDDWETETNAREKMVR